MPKQVIISMGEHYPFGECEECTTESTRVLVRKIYQASLQERNKLIQKLSTLRKLKNENMIKIESVLEEDESVHLLFEYIPIKLETWISNINDQFIQNFRDQLIKFSSFLANNAIKIEFQLRNIGMDQNYNAKYFMDLNFQIGSSVNREKLKSTYIRDITNLFKPYIVGTMSTTSHESKPLKDSIDLSSKERQKGRENTRFKETAAISPPTNKPSSKNKDKALEKYYQQVNMSVDSQNQKILQEFMDVLDNEDGGDANKGGMSQPPAKKEASSKNKEQALEKYYQEVNMSVDSQKEKILYQFMDVLDNEDGDGNKGGTNQPPAKKEQIFQKGEHKEANSMQILPKKKYTNSTLHQNSSFTEREVYSPNKNVSVPVHGQSLNKTETPPLKSNNSSTQNRARSEMIDSNLMMKESEELQSRVRSAIEKSLTVIKKFKTIRQSQS